MTRSNAMSRVLLGAVAAAGVLAVTTGAAVAGPFSSFEGNWVGNGTVTVNNGTKERLRCRAHYDVGGTGDTLEQNLTCASDSYKFNVVASVKADGKAISGSWSETSRGANGAIVGSIGPTQISAQVNGPGFSARIGIAARGGRQSVTISPTGTDITNVSVTMSKG